MNVKGVTISTLNKSSGFYKLKISKGKYKTYNFTYYREYFKDKLGLTLLWINDLEGKFLGCRLKHISNKRVIKKLDRFV